MKRKVLLVDNVDSFTFNLVQALRTLGAEVLVRRANELELEEAHALEPTHLVVSPGPGRPEAAVRAQAVMESFLPKIPVLGVCLGHQCLGLIAGARVDLAAEPQHGKSIRVYHDGRPPFRGLPNPFEAGRYHSLIVLEEGLTEDYEVSAWSSDGEILGLRHKTRPVNGLQFHPESVLTPVGARILKSFLASSVDGDPSPEGGREDSRTDEVPA